MIPKQEFILPIDSKIEPKEPIILILHYIDICSVGDNLDKIIFNLI